MFRLGSRVERMLITARKEGTSVVTSFQAMAWGPKAAVRQATAFVVLFATRDRDMIKATAQGIGPDWRQVGCIVGRMAREPRAESAPPVLPRAVRAPLVL